MTQASLKGKRNNIDMGKLNIRRAAVVYLIVTSFLLEQICTASYQEAVIVREKSCNVEDIPNSRSYPEAGIAANQSFYRILDLHDNLGSESHMYVGGKNSLTELRLNNLTLMRELSVPRYTVEIDFPCDKIQRSEYYCHNYVTFMQEINATTSIVCGTNFLTPRCVTFETASNDLTIHDWPAVGISASGPDQDTMTYIKSDGENMVIYSGAPTRIQYNYAFSRIVIGPDGGSNVVKTDTSDPNWIQTSTSLDPSFVGQPIEYNGKIYFFFREEAVEARNVAKVVYSRVGQVCANDPGGVEDWAGKFTTFLKARLSCATAGDFQMSFDYLHGIFRSPQNSDIIFGAFTTPDSAFAASAVCAYNLAEIENVFASSAFRKQQTGSSLWLNVPANDVPQDPRPGECSPPQRMADLDSSLLLLMSKIVPSKADYFSPPRTDMTTSPPLILLQQYRFQKLVVQETAVSGLPYDIFFLGTSEGQILKAYIYYGTPRIVDEIYLNLDSDGPEAINVLRISADGNTVFASTTSRVYSVPTENCQRFKTCAECVSGQDPACSWELQGKQGCIASQDGVMDLEYGNHSSCPVASSTPTSQTNPATPASETTNQTPSSPGTTTGSGRHTPKSKTQTGECEEGNRMELNICFPWILSSVLIVCCCNIPTCIVLFLSCKKRKKNYPSPLRRNRDESQKVPLRSIERLNSDLAEEAEGMLTSTETETNGSPHRSTVINENSSHEKKNGQSVAMRIPSANTPVRGTTMSSSEA